MPTCVANGRIGIVPDVHPFRTRQVVLNHVFDRAGAYDISRVLSGINPFNLKVCVDGEEISLGNSDRWEQSLNMKEAALHTSLRYGKKATVNYSIQALRNMPYGGLMQVTIVAKKAITLDVSNYIVTPENYNNVRSLYRMMRDLDARMPVFQTTADSPYGAQQLAAASGFIFEGERPDLSQDTNNPYQSHLSFSLELKKGQSYTFSLFGAVCSSRDFNDPYGESERMVVFAQREGPQRLVQKHQEAWSRLWESDIIIEGDLESQRDVRFALYNLYSYQRGDSDLSTAPMGLSAQGYNGHIFWDAELWMYPPLLVLQPEMGRSMMNYRVDRLPKAQQKARNFGFKGAMYPWESDDSGEEATPSWCLTGVLEQHITADVGIAIRVTKDELWLKEKGWPVLKSVAEFWASRVEQNSDSTYSIVNVVGANEFAHGVTDNSFTNGSVKVVMDNAIKAAALLNQPIADDWTAIRDAIRIEQFADGTTKEHSTYKGEIIKQADVNLLAYPLNVITDEATIAKDLNYYEAKIALEGPAMAYAIFSILHARLGNADKAYELFQRGYIPNKRAPFGVLAESAVSNNPYFATGAGGMLQAVLFGFAGLELTDDGIIQQEPCLPKHWKSLTITGVGVEKKTIRIEQ